MTICRQTACGCSPRRPVGLTLPELLIALAIVAILATVVLPSFQTALTKARRTEARAALLKTMQWQEEHYTRFNTYFSFEENTAMGNLPFRPYTSDTPAASYYGLSAKPCGADAGERLDSCIVVTATPGTAVGGQPFKDPLCGALSLSSAGIRKATGSGGEQCWQ